MCYVKQTKKLISVFFLITNNQAYFSTVLIMGLRYNTLSYRKRMSTKFFELSSVIMHYFAAEINIKLRYSFKVAVTKCIFTKIVLKTVEVPIS